MKYRLAVFDMDGTILNTIEDIADSANFFCKKYGFPEHTYEEYKYFVGNGLPKMLSRALPEGIKGSEFQKILKEFLDYYPSHSAIKTRPYDGIVECIKSLKAAGVKVAVNTNKVQAAAEDLCKVYFPDLFDCIMGSRPDLPVKPDPTGLYEILKELGLSKDEACQPGVACFIGDSDVDLQTGLNSGLDFIGVDWGFRGRDFLQKHGAEVVVMNTDELLEKLVK